MTTISRSQVSTNRLTFRPARASDRDDICSLFHAVHGRRKSIEEHQWLYERNPSGIHRTWVAIDQDTGQLVGARPVFPWRVSIGGKEVLASQAGDAMTHPAWRRQGIFTALVVEAWSGLREDGIPFSYSFSNPGSLSVYHKVKISVEEPIGTHEIGKLCRWVRPLSWKTYLSRRRITAPFSTPLGKIADLATNLVIRPSHATKRAGLSFRRIHRFDERFNDLWVKASSYLSVLGVRDAAFLNWRYIDAPNERHTVLIVEHGDELLGYAVVELLHKQDGFTEGYIFDLLTAPETPALDSLLEGTLGWFKEARATQVIFPTLEGHPYEGRLRRWGFIQRGSDRPFAIHIHIPTPSDHIVLNARKWYVTLGDKEIESAA